MGGSRPVAILALAVALILCSCRPVLGQSTCSTQVQLTGSENAKNFQKCASLPKLGSSLAWNYNATSRFFEFAFRATLTDKNGWAGWGIHPTAQSRMIGASAFIAFTSSTNGSNVLPYKLTGIPSAPSAIDLEVIDNTTFVSINDLDVTFGATLRLKENQTTLNQLWNVGSSVEGFTPQQHSLSGDNSLSYNQIDIAVGTVTQTEVAHIDLKNSHGIINGLAWGILFPLGVIAARYMRPFKVFDPLWFYLHVGCQVSAYILGATGWGLGLKLGSYSANEDDDHQNIGTAMFTLATLQLTALFLRPNPDHQYRKYWNVYHHLVGYTLIILSVVNIFKGIDLLSPAKSWKVAYVVILIIVAAVALILEIGTWTAWCLKRKRIPPTKLQMGGGEAGEEHRPAVYGADNPRQWVGEPQL